MIGRTGFHMPKFQAIWRPGCPIMSVLSQMAKITWECRP